MTSSTSTTTAAQRGNVLAVPAPAANETLRVDMVPGSEVQLPFEPGQATVSRSENSLVFELDNGGTVTINNFFVTENEGELPTLLLPQGEEVPAAVVFADSGLDLTTAAGPAASSSNSSGSGEYADSAGDLLGGLERLGSLGTDQWGRSTEAPEYQQSALTVAGAATGGSGTPDEPVGPVGPSGPFDYVARGVMYPGNPLTRSEPGQLQAGPQVDVELNVDLLSNGGKGHYPAGQAPDSVDLSFFGADGEPIADPLQWLYDQASGKITFIGCPPDGVYYILVQDSSGNKYYMQIVVDANGDFDSKAQDAETPPYGGELSHGEWHSGKGTPLDGKHDVTSSNLDDEMTFASGIYGATIKTGHATDRNWGDDRILVEGNAQNSDIDFGNGTGKLTVNGTVGAMDGNSTIKMAHGTIDVNAKSATTAFGVRADTYSTDSAMKIEGGDSTVTIKANGVLGANGVSAANKGSLVDIKAGSITIDAAATGASATAYGVKATDGATVKLAADGKVDIDATGKNALGIHATGNGSTVDITAKDVDITAKGDTSGTWARGMQAWGGENNSVSIHSKGGAVNISAYGAEGYAMSAEGKGNKTLIEGAEKVTLKASHTGMSASTGDASNTIKGGEVHITVDGQGVSHSGMYAAEGKNIIENASSVTIEALKGGQFSAGMTADYKGENTITSTGDVTITAKDGTSKNYGLNATAGSNSITSTDGDVKITATGNAAENVAIRATQGATTTVTAANGTVTLDSTGSGFGKGIDASGKSTVTIDAHDVNIKTDGKYASQGSNALRNDDSEITIHSNGGKVTLEAGGTVGWHAGMLTMSGGTSKIHGAKETVITAKDDGMSAAGGTNIIDGTGVAGDSVRINAGGAMYAVGMGLNKIMNVDNVYMGSEAKRADTGMNVYNTGENSVENAKHVEMYAKSYGMITQGGYNITAKNSIQADDVTINVANTAAGSNVKGMYAKENTALNTISAKDVDISVIGVGSSMGMHAQSKGANTIYSDGGTVSVTARGGESYGMYTNGGDQSSNPDQSKNLIQGASKVTVAADNIGMNANRGTNTIKDITGKAGENAVEIIADGASATGRSGMYAANHQGNSFNTLSENRIENVTGNVAVTASGAGGSNAGMNAYTYQQKSGEGIAKNIITGVNGDVTVSALNGETNYAMRAFAQTGSNPTANIIKDVSGTVTLKATGSRESHGMSASGQNASNTISNAGSVNITAETGINAYGTNAFGMYAEGSASANIIGGVTKGNVDVTAKGGNSSAGMYANGGQNLIQNVKGDVNVSALDSVTNQAMRASAGSGGQNIIENVSGTVTLKASGGTRAEGMIAYGQNNSNTIRNAGSVDIRVEGGNPVGMYADKGGANSITAANDVKITSTAIGNFSATGLNALSAGSRNTIAAGGDVDIKVTSGTYANGIAAGAGGSNEIVAGGDGTVRVTVRSGIASTGLSASGSGSSNTISAGGGVYIAAEGGTGDAVGATAREAFNAITAGGDVVIKATDAQNNAYGVAANTNGVNSITAGGDVRVTAGAAGNAWALESYVNSTNTIVAGGDVEITATAGMISTGLVAGNYGSNTIDAGGDVKVTATTTATTSPYSAYGLHALVNGANTITAGGVEITAEGGGSAYAMHAESGGHNTIDSRLVVGDGPVGIILTAKGVAASFAMYASDAGSTNAIYGSLTRDNNIKLRGDIYAQGGGKNILQTGAGDDQIMIDGKVSGNFQFNAGDGYDTLELRAASWDDFSARYQTWLSANFDDMSIENLQWVLGDSSGSVPTWLISLINSYNSLHPDAPLDVDYAALGIEPPVSESAHANNADVHTETDSANTAHVSDTSSASDASQIVPGAGDAHDANAAAHADNQSNNPNQERESTLEDIRHTDDNGQAVNNHVDHNGDATHDAIFGGGDDHVQIHGNIDGTEHGNVDFILDEGHNTLIVDGDARHADITGGDNGNDISIHGEFEGNIDLGDGADRVDLGSMHDGTVDLGEGHNTLIVDGDARHADITGGDNGNDISIHGAFEGNIDLGGGADRVDLGSMHGGTVNLGEGDDTLLLHGFTGGLLNGGEGDDTLILTLDGLNGNDAFGNSGAFSGLFAEGAVKDFESLVLDMTGDSEDALDLGALLDSLKGLGGGEDLTVRITGDTNDHVDTTALIDAGWSCQDNGDGTSHWTSADEAALTIIIQNGL